MSARVIAETAHFRVIGQEIGGWYVTAKHNIGGPSGPALSHGVTYYPELQAMIEEFKQELSDLLEQVKVSSDAWTLTLDIPIGKIDDLERRRGLSLRFSIFRRDGYQCQICGRSAARHGVVLEIDHRIPRAKGGTDSPANLWTLCFDCNRGKSDSDL